MGCGEEAVERSCEAHRLSLVLGEGKSIEKLFSCSPWRGICNVLTSHLLFDTCGSPLSPSPPLILAVPLISIVHCLGLAWHPTTGNLLARVMQLDTHTHTHLFYPECSFSLAITQSCSAGGNRTY